MDNEPPKGFRYYFHALLDKLLVHILWTGLVALIGIAVAFFISRKLEFSTLEILLFVIILVFIIGVLSFIIYRRNNRRIPSFDPLDFNFHMLREERVHRWLDENNYTHERRYTLKALKNGITHYTDRFQWTGTSYELSGGNSDYKVEKDIVTKNVFDVYQFKFSKPLMKGDVIEVEASWKATGPARPFFSTTIEEPTDVLIMSVMLYPSSGITQVVCEIETYKGAKMPYISTKQKLNSDGEYVWQVKNPKLIHHYEINWETKNT